MAYTLKSRLLGYDNIANGSATGMERHNAAAGAGDGTTRENFDSVVTSTEGVNTSSIANRPHELEVGWTGVNVSDANVHGPIGTADADKTPTSATTPGYTSTTSWTSTNPERTGWTSAVFP